MRLKNTLMIIGILCLSMANSFAQEQPPAPGAPKSVTIPAVKEKTLPNGLQLAVVERRNMPLVTVDLVLNAGARLETDAEAGTADVTASLLTKGTKAKTATQIAEEIEFLGGSINSGAGWNSANVSVTVTSDKLQQAMVILSDVVLNPAFSEKELELLKSQTLDGLTYNLKQPGFLANYAASKYIFDEHPAGGTPETIKALDQKKVQDFYQENYLPYGAVLIFTGDITLQEASTLAVKFFGAWKGIKRKELIQDLSLPPSNSPNPDRAKTSEQKILVIDLPKSGQAAVNYGKSIEGGRVEYGKVGSTPVQGRDYFPAIVLNSVLGGGYSSRLNYEIRIKRGLSYGAGSSFAWRDDKTNFATRIQTKTVSAAEVLELVMAEIKRLSDSSVSNDELTPRKSVLTGNFGRSLETTAGLAAALGELYAFEIPANELNTYATKVNGVTDSQIKDFARQNLTGGKVVIVGDYSDFKDDLAKRFPNMRIDVIKADELDLSKDNLRK